MTSSVARRVSIARIVVLAALLALAPGCAEPTPAEDAGPVENAGPPQRVTIDRFEGELVERHPEFLRYRFVAQGEDAMIVELARRRDGQTGGRGTDELVVQPAPGGPVTPELLDAVARWLADGGLGQDPFATPEPAEQRPPPEQRIPPGDERPIRIAGALGLGLLAAWSTAALACAIAWFRRRDRASPSSPGPGARSTLIVVGVTLAVALLGLGLRLALAAPSPLDDDAMHDVGVATVCAGGDPCSYGAASSFGGFRHGSGYTRWLGLLLAAGLDVAGVHAMLMIGFALAVAVVFDTGRRLARDALEVDELLVGMLAAVAVLGLLLAELSGTGEIVWHPAAMALPAAVTQAGLIQAARTGRPAGIVIAGLAAGVAFDIHLAGLALWPMIVVVALATVRDDDPAASRWARLARALAWLPAIAGALAVTMVLSPRLALDNGRVLLDRAGWLGLGLAALLPVALGLGLRLAARRATGRKPALLVAVGVPIATLLATLTATSGFVGAQFVRYFAPVFPAVALAGAWVIAIGLAAIPPVRVRVIAAALVAGLALAVALPPYLARMTVDRDRWNYADVDRIAAFLRERDVTRGEVPHVVRGGVARGESHANRGQRNIELLVGGLRAFGELGDDPPSAAPERSRAWMVAKLRDGELPPLPEGATTLASDAGHTIVLAPYRPIADLAGLRWCAEAESGDRRCVPATPRPAELGVRRILPRHDVEQTEDFSYELPLHVPADSASSRCVELQLLSASRSHAWQITAVHGPAQTQTQTQTQLPATSLGLTLAPGADATVILSAVEPTELGRWPPLLAIPDDPRIRALLLAPADGTTDDDIPPTPSCAAARSR